MIMIKKIPTADTIATPVTIRTIFQNLLSGCKICSSLLLVAELSPIPFSPSNTVDSLSDTNSILSEVILLISFLTVLLSCAIEDVLLLSVFDALVLWEDDSLFLLDCSFDS